MITHKSFEETKEDYIRKKTFDYVTFDLETRDSGKLNIWNAEIISYSLCFVKKLDENGKNALQYALWGEIIENLNEEKQLLQNILDLFELLKETEITGHNIQLYQPCKRDWRNTRGYDFPKIQDRSSYFKLDWSILSKLRTYDTMNEGFYHYNHEFKLRFQRDGRPKRILSSVEIEEDFKIIRPKSIPKLGANVRSIYDNKQDNQRFSLILKYNFVDTIIEATITSIFKELKEKKGIISPDDTHTVFQNSMNVEELGIFSFVNKL